MRVSSRFNYGELASAFLVLLLGALVSVTPASAAMSPPEITVACNSLARMAFDLKDLVNVVALKMNPGPFQVHSLLRTIAPRHGCADLILLGRP